MSWLQNANMQILPSIDQTDQWCLVKCTHQKFEKYAFYQIHLAPLYRCSVWNRRTGRIKQNTTLRHIIVFIFR